MAQLLAASCVLLYRRKSFWLFLEYQALMAVFVFLFYLPAICFSGLAAFTDNKYVKPITDSVSAFLPDFVNYFKSVVNYCFSSLWGENSIVSFILFGVPLLLFFFKKKEERFLAFFYLLTWGTFIAMSLYMRHPSFYRNLIIQYSVTMGLVAYTMYALVYAVAMKLKTTRYQKAFTMVFFGIPLIALSYHLVRHDKKDVSTNLYFNNVNELYTIHTKDIGTIPNSSSISFSDGSFYFYYYCRKLHYKASRCPNGNEDYYVNRPDETLPNWVTNNYTLFRKCEEDYDIYKRE
jgi:hypothetical protein